LRGGTRAAEIVTMVNEWLFNRSAIEQNVMKNRYFHGKVRLRHTRATKTPQWRRRG
jgi:hypothetical protein